VLDEFDTYVTAASIWRALESRGWTKITNSPIAKGRTADLRVLYIHKSWDSGSRSYQYVFVDESGCDKRSEFRRMDGHPLGACILFTSLHQGDKRMQGFVMRLAVEG
jgi:hypothetical protein